MLNNSIKALIHISHKIGKDPAYVQGGGGNTSVKLDNKLMAIKSSGSTFKDMSLENGYSIVDYIAIRDYLIAPDPEEHVFTKRIKSFVFEKNSRPSIETGFHAQLGTFVIHTHSIYANLLTCSKEGKDIVKALFPNSLWIDYATPGCELSLAIKNNLTICRQKASVLFLQNHGIIVVEQSTKAVINLHEKINKTIRDYFNLKLAVYEEKAVDIIFMKEHILFPDQVVYTLSGENILETSAAKETFWAYEFILRTIKDLNLTHHYIPKKKAEALLYMESEEFRRKAIEK